MTLKTVVRRKFIPVNTTAVPHRKGPQPLGGHPLVAIGPQDSGLGEPALHQEARDLRHVRGGQSIAYREGGSSGTTLSQPLTLEATRLA